MHAYFHLYNSLFNFFFVHFFPFFFVYFQYHRIILFLAWCIAYDDQQSSTQQQQQQQAHFFFHINLRNSFLFHFFEIIFSFRVFVYILFCSYEIIGYSGSWKWKCMLYAIIPLATLTFYWIILVVIVWLNGIEKVMWRNK
jgi:hypothetical protein